MDDVLDHIQALQLYESSQRLRERAVTGCWKWIAEAIADGDLQGITAADLDLRFRRCALIFSPGFVSYPFFETAYAVLSKKHSSSNLLEGFEEIANYRLITSVDGDDIDDYFVIERLGGKPATD